MSAICDECGAPLEGRVAKSGLVTCRYCGSGHDVHRLSKQGRGALIAAADFSGEAVGGWHVGPRLTGEPVGGDPPAWRLSMAADTQTHPLLWAPGSYDDFDVTIAVRFLSGDARDSVFLRARSTSTSAVSMHVWRGGGLALGWLKDNVWQPHVVEVQPVKPSPEGAWRRVRWTAVGARHRAWLDGALVLTATHEPIRNTGHLDVRLRVQDGASMTVEIAELAVFEPPQA